MAIQTQVQVIDADAHVVETERTWDYLEPSEQKYRPLLYASPHDPVSQYWVIDNQVRGLRFPTLAEQTVREMSRRSGRAMATPQEPESWMTWRCVCSIWMSWELMCRCGAMRPLHSHNRHLLFHLS